MEVNCINDYYSNYDEHNRLTSNHGLIEFLTTMKYIEKYLKQGDKVIEIGAATGRYSHDIARKGYEVDAVELVEHNIEIFKKNTLINEKITITQGNAMCLDIFADNKYEITLLLGPMYHLYNDEDKIKALSEAIRVTKKGGIIFVSYCITDASILLEGFKNGYIHEFIENNMLDIETFIPKSAPIEIFELTRKENIDMLMKNFNVTRLHYIASDGYTNHIREEVDKMDDKTFELYLKYHFTICERSDLVGISHHSLDVFKKI